MHIVPRILEWKKEIFLQFLYINLGFIFFQENLLDFLYKWRIFKQLSILPAVIFGSFFKVVAVVNSIVKLIILSKNVQFEEV